MVRRRAERSPIAWTCGPGATDSRRQITNLESSDEPTILHLRDEAIEKSQSIPVLRNLDRRTVLSQLAAVAKYADKNTTNQILRGLDTVDGNPLAIGDYALLWDTHMATLSAVRSKIADLLA